MQDEERRDSLVLRDVCHRREVAMLRRAVAELLPVSVGRQQAMVDGHEDDARSRKGLSTPRVPESVPKRGLTTIIRPPIQLFSCRSPTVPKNVPCGPAMFVQQFLANDPL